MSEELFGGVVPSGSPDFRSELAVKLAELVPEVIADGKVDVAKLQELLGSNASDDKLERFGLFWPGKRRALQAAQELTTATLLPDLENSRDWDTTGNVFIEGDNLEVLKILQRHYHGKIKMIYIDPPYNTGKDFVYPDNYKEGLASYLEWTKQVNDEGKKISTNSDTDGRYHSNWLSMMYPRLKLAKNLLTEDGVIFISIDDNEYENLKKICNEIFGENNHVSTLPRVTKRAGKSGDNISLNHDYVLVYSKGSEGKINRIDHTDSGFKNVDEFFEQRGKYKLNQTLDYDTLGYVSSLDYAIDIEGLTLYPGSVTHSEHLERRMRNPKDGYRWRWSAELFEFGLKNGFVVLKQGKNGPRIYTKTYEYAAISDKSGQYEVILEQRTKAYTSLDLTSNSFSNDNAKKDIERIFGFAAFDYTKPVALIRELLSMATSPGSGDIVLDFFAGSGTTGHAVYEANNEDEGNRTFIQVQLPEPTPENSDAHAAGYLTISELSRDRLTRSTEDFQARMDVGLLGGKILDTGFRAYRLAESNFPVWRVSSGTSVSELEQRINEIAYSNSDTQNSFDCLIELLIKLGFSLKVSLNEINSDVFEAYLVADGNFIAVVRSKKAAKLEDFASLLDLKPSRFLVMEDTYQGSDELKTNLEQECSNRQIELIKR